MKFKSDSELATVAAKVGDIFLFNGADDAKTALLCDGCEIKKYAPGEHIPETDAAKLGVVIKGSLIVTPLSNEIREDASHAILRIIPEGGIFGAASIFSGGDTSPLTHLTARQSSKVVLFSRRLVEDIVRKNPDAAVRYIEFLSGRVKYLNRKIDVFTAGSAKSRLAFYISEVAGGGDGAEIKVTLASLAAALDIGRASLYRALDALVADGAIERFGRTIRVKDASALLRSAK